MKRVRQTLAVVAVAGSIFGLSACGGDDGGSSSTPSSKTDFATLFIAGMKQSGTNVDEACVKDAVNQIPDADFEKIAGNMEDIASGAMTYDELGLSTDAAMAFLTMAGCIVGS